jgi:hypothetical protein
MTGHHPYSGPIATPTRAQLTHGRSIEVRKGRYIGSSMHGTLGSGAGRLSIETVNGPISVHGS